MASLTFTDLQTRVMNKLRLPTTNTTEATKIAADINDVYREIYAMHDWWWLDDHTVINTVAPHETGTVAVTAGSASITFSSAPALSRVRNVLYVSGNATDWGAMYRIATHTAASAAATLDAEYTGETDSAAAFRVSADQYGLPSNCGKLLKVKVFGASLPLELVGPHVMHDLKSNDLTVGKPRVASVHEFQTAGDPTTVRQLFVHPFPDDTYRMEVFFKQGLNTELSGTTRPFIPDDYVYILVYGVLGRAFATYLNDLRRAQYFQALYDGLLAKMISAQRERGSDNPQIIPMDVHRQFYTKPRRHRGHISLGSYFDRLPNEP